MNFPPAALFLSFAGVPLNFRIICSKSSSKTEALSKIMIHGGVSQRSHGSARLILMGGGLPCEQGHFKCEAHPKFSKEPAFDISWIDDSIESNELLDIKGYLLNPSPTFARIDFMEMILDGAYKPPPPAICITPEPKYRVIEVKIPCDGNSTQDLENESIIMAACRRSLSSVIQGDSAEPSPPSQSSGSHHAPVATSSSTRDQNLFQIKPPNPVNVLGNSQASSTPFRRLPASSANCSSTSSSDDGEPIEIHKRKKCVNQRASKPAPSGPPSARPVVPVEAKAGTSGCPTEPPERRLQQTTADNLGSKLPTTFSSSSESDSPAPKKFASPTKKVVRSKFDSSDSDTEFGPPPTSFVQMKGVRQNTRESYTKNEERAILNYIVASKKFTGVKSDVIWKAMDGKPGLEKRSWHSLKNHFLKFMLPDLEKFNLLTTAQIKMLRSTK